MKEAKNDAGRTMQQAYDQWRYGRRAVHHNLNALKLDLTRVSTEGLGLVGVDVALPGLRKQLDFCIEEAAKARDNPSCRDLLAWTGPPGAILHIAERCRVAMEDYAAEHDRPQNLGGLCAVASRLFQKKASRYGKWQLVRGIVNDGTHVWCARNGVALDLTRTQFAIGVDRVFVMPACMYPCDTLLGDVGIDVETELAQAERFYTCDAFVKRKGKAK